MEACFHLLDFYSPKAAVFSSSVLCDYGLLLHVLSETMLSSILAEVLSSTALSSCFLKLGKDFNILWHECRNTSVGSVIIRDRQAVVKGCSFDESRPWMGNSLVPVPVQLSFPQYHLVIRNEVLPCGMCLLGI